MDTKNITEKLSQNERKIVPYLEAGSVREICKRTNLDKVSVLRALEYLQNKDIVKLDYRKNKIIGLGVNGALYKKKGLPERRLLNLLDEKRIVFLKNAAKETNMSGEEFKASLGALKKKAMVEIKNGKIILDANKSEISKKMLEESLLESLPIKYEKITPEQKFALKSLQNRKNIIETREEQEVNIKITDLGREIINKGVKSENLVEQVTPDMIKKESAWKGKKFRRYDVVSPVPKIYGGKKHFVNQAMDYARKVWTEMGFKEMKGSIVVSSFWNFDALFTAQDHPVREIQDTFFINKTRNLPSEKPGLNKNEIKKYKKIIENVKNAHETGTSGSKGWRYNWNSEEAKRLLLRTHTTCLSAKKLASIDLEKDTPARFFSVGRCFRNETLDWSHGFEFNQTEGIVIDENANFKHLLGYLKQFAKKMGFDKIRFRPAYFPYTEPSLEGDVWDEERGEWVELIAAGIFRPEVTEPLLGKPVPVLAWGPGFDRMVMKIFGIKDLREMYKNDINKLRKMKFFPK
ncbi:MAG TPA: phenylalanine--tRNA ligase subunit alpha [Candidatus Nanoarchaeia archaeon]|nr:phenylalanine--tRNA ligase subunit alpha [Candidatus Nanoarchaeia archaeon]